MKNAFLVWDDAFTAAELDAITALGDAALSENARLAAGARDGAVRVTQVAWLAPDARTQSLYDKLAALVQTLNSRNYRFDITGLETLQYAVYHGGGHYDWHIDYGPDNTRPRKLSLSLQLTDGDAYDGCDLQFQTGPATGSAPRRRGALIAFPSFVLHRVTPITRGIRKSLVIWANGPEFR
jgi:PKHD-type hydroxylase